MKKVFALLVFLILLEHAYSKQIDEITAKLVGRHFIENNVSSASFKKGVSLELVYESTSQEGNVLSTNKPTRYFYVFSISSNADGFVIVSADDHVLPILGYSNQMDFNPNTIPANVRKWLEGYKNEIRYIIQNNIGRTNEIALAWEQLINGAIPIQTFSKKASVNPLITTQWNQSPYVNDLCPFDYPANERTVSGCVATAMAQVMKYWNYPATGFGSHSYNHSKYGTLSANFGSTSYNWSAMPNLVNSPNAAVATLMFHCGVSVEMIYNTESNGGSGAYVSANGNTEKYCSENALKKYFGFKPTLSTLTRSNYSNSQWINLLKVELNAERPIIYVGSGGSSSHAFICDGYNSNDFFHFNWGWGGAYDGYFQLNSLIVGSQPGYNFSFFQYALMGIEPPDEFENYNLQLYAPISTIPNQIVYDSGFTVYTTVKNFGVSFSGDIKADIYNSRNEFITTIEVKQNQTIGFNSTSSIAFSTSGKSTLTPGEYAIGLYYKSASTSQWIALGNGNYQNFKAVEVKGDYLNPLKLSTAIHVSPSNIIRNRPFSISFNVSNFDTAVFTGDITIDILKSDGTRIRELAKKSGLSLQPNAQFTENLTYTFDEGINDEPGTYQFFVGYKPTGGNWEILGFDTVTNPVFITISNPEPIPDIYEFNNTDSTAFNVPLLFPGNIASTLTTGSSIHTGNDIDYYKLELPAGYTYTIYARIHDSYNSGIPTTYTVDALISYSQISNLWSDTYDDIISNAIIVKGGGSVYFKVYPYFTGNTGTYVFEAVISRNLNFNFDKDILTFTTPGLVGEPMINNSTATVDITVQSGTIISSLVPTITISDFATISPASDTPQDFTLPVTYTITALDGSTKRWIVNLAKHNTGLIDADSDETIRVFPNPAREYLKFDIKSFKGQIENVSIFDIQGKEFFTQFDPSHLTIPLINFKQGLYILRIKTNMGVMNKKFIIEPN